EGQVRWDQVTPYSDHVYVHAVEDEDGSPWTWSLGATVMCADPLPGYEIVKGTSSPNSNSYNFAPAYCTGSHVLLGMGFAINNGNGEVGIDDFTPLPNYAMAGAYEDGDGFSGTWSVTSYGICADKPAGYEIVTSTGVDQSDYSTIHDVSCTAGDNIVS